MSYGTYSMNDLCTLPITLARVQITNLNLQHRAETISSKMWQRELIDNLSSSMRPGIPELCAKDFIEQGKEQAQEIDRPLCNA